MKKKITILLSMIIISILITNCASPKKRMNKNLSKTYIGMSISEFHQIFSKKDLISMKEEITVYKVVENPYYGGVRTHRFFYFKDNKLSRVDKGERSVDKRIRIDTN